MYGLKYYFYLIFLSLSSCSIYSSPQRNEFENNYNQIKLENLNRLYCSDESLKNKALSARLVHLNTEESMILWELQLKKNTQNPPITQYESDNLKGEYCLYEYLH